MEGFDLTKMPVYFQFDQVYSYNQKELIDSNSDDFKYISLASLKGVLAKNERGYRRKAKNKRKIILLLSVASIRRKLLKTIHTEERSAHTNSESCNIQLGS